MSVRVSGGQLERSCFSGRFRNSSSGIYSLGYRRRGEYSAINCGGGIGRRRNVERGARIKTYGETPGGSIPRSGADAGSCKVQILIRRLLGVIKCK
jgi:hypothetical protein